MILRRKDGSIRAFHPLELQTPQRQGIINLMPRLPATTFLHDHSRRRGKNVHLRW